ncbi:hypothetical protein BURK1_03547 [Burkholderiales bacterium]|nr:hypothetical protein BURK1_03547 [Burkholderiales bacterium]
MEREDLMRHLAGWRDGVDPVTGATLPPDHPAQRSDFLRVVCQAIDALASCTPTAPTPARRASTPGPGHANAGRPWSAEEDALLAQAHEAGIGVVELARAHGRTPGAITLRLVKLGRIELPPGLRMRGGAGPAAGASPP